MPSSTRPLMGSTPYSGAGLSGVTFRVWAPFALNVGVSGSFNGWGTTALFKDGNSGYWSVDVPGAKEGDQYKYAITDQWGNTLWRMDPYADTIVYSGGSLNAVVATTAVQNLVPTFVMPNWNELVIYEIHLGTFSNIGGIKGNGGFQGVINQLDYLRDLGINAIELLPLGQFIGDYSSGYNPAYMFAIENEFGGPDGFRNLVNQAHLREIAVIIDVVYNHLGNSAGDMWDFDGWSENGKGGIYFYNDWRSHTEYAETRFDYGRTEVCQYLRDNAICWIQERLADGLRF